MRILITGGSGFLGSRLATTLTADGHSVIILSRNPGRHQRRSALPLTWIQDLSEITRPLTAVVNLAGANLFTRPWSGRRKRELWQSRIQTTETLVHWIRQQTTPPEVLLSGSATGFYGDQGDAMLTEVSAAGRDWPSQLVMAWENSALAAEAAGVRTLCLRTGLVLGRGGGLLQPLLPLFRAGLGGSLADGEFWYSWIHLDDWVRAVTFLLAAPTLRGPVNLTAPEPVRYREFAHTLAQTLRRPAWLSPPRWALQPVLGERANLVLASTRAIPQQLSDCGFNWQYPELTGALTALTQRTEGPVD